MDIRQIAVVGSFAAAAALAFAPVASAVPSDPLTPTVDTEIASLNSLFVSEATLAGVPSTDYSLADGFDAIKLADIAKDTPLTAPFSTLDYELFGVNPGVAGVAVDPGSYNVFNGALTEFYDAYNVELFSSLNPSDAIASIPLGDLFGSEDGINEALAFGTAAGAAGDFLTDGWNDLLGYFGVFGA
jgi:hypothetical protein